MMTVIWSVQDLLRADHPGHSGYFGQTSLNLAQLGAGGVLFEGPMALACSLIAHGSSLCLRRCLDTCYMEEDEKE